MIDSKFHSEFDRTDDDNIRGQLYEWEAGYHVGEFLEKVQE